MYQLTPGQRLLRRTWDGEHVLYNDLSGDTHLLGDAAMQFLLKLYQGPCSVSALAALLPGGQEQPAALAAALLSDLEALALVEPVAC